MWEWYTWRQELIAGSIAKAGHKAFVSLVEHQAKQSAGFEFITQNVAGLHRQAHGRAVI